MKTYSITERHFISAVCCYTAINHLSFLAVNANAVYVDADNLHMAESTL